MLCATAAASVLVLAGLGSCIDGAALTRRVWLGGGLIELKHPASGVRVPHGGLAVLVAFPDQDRVLPDTFRCVLNGRDLTRELARDREGATGSLSPLREGSNRLRVEIFGRGLWGDRFYQDVVEVEFEVPPLYTLDRAALPPPPSA